MTTKDTSPDCGVAVGQPHKDECDEERCPTCGGHWITCPCVGHGHAPRPCESTDELSFARSAQPTLAESLSMIPPGIIPDPSVVAGQLAGQWHRLDGSREGGMQPHKLLGRMEQVTWNPPILRFVIERHGGTMCGSTRAELQHWEVNVHAETAEIVKTGHRQLHSMAPRISIKGLAEEIAQAILSGVKHRGYSSDKSGGNIVVDASLLFPTGSGFKRTVEGRRMRLCDYIAAILAEHGWRKVGWNRLQHVTQTKEQPR